jgi:ABC-type antimicrobial peptide transport system permease subunit
MVGLYGTMAYGIARRQNEFGIRLALGAARASVVRMVLGEAGRLAAAGVLLGAIGALAASRLVSTFLYGVTPTDPRTLALSAGALVVVALAAGALPAWRVARLDPVAALRED